MRDLEIMKVSGGICFFRASVWVADCAACAWGIGPAVVA